jgi:hypothetical protein
MIGIRVPVGSRIFFSACRPDRIWGPHSLLMVTGGSFQGIKRQGSEADHSPPASAEVKEMWIYTSTPPYSFMSLCLVRHKDNFTFALYVFTLFYSDYSGVSDWVVECNPGPSKN